MLKFIIGSILFGVPLAVVLLFLAMAILSGMAGGG